MEDKTLKKKKKEEEDEDEDEDLGAVWDFKEAS